ncbi:uncharacterized protein LOC126750384 [Anthonomus grandis grandis]|uniref:uncharacterized protein LOC126750384 n=1 Tax=Anthonomus grandis grandis TaxID=2921223 RepID=UPI0021665F23|nr:uncharacterized protein LOC126750384 [Anthonomus grandis grandis]
MSQSNTELNDLYENLKNDLRKDKMYWIRNDAKLRAVVTAKSYDEFRDYVDAAHLKSVTREDGKRKASTSWNKAI